MTRVQHFQVTRNIAVLSQQQGPQVGQVPASRQVTEYNDLYPNLQLLREENSKIYSRSNTSKKRSFTELRQD
ncbi:hypothetical protein CH272_11525 [Rhodococcus sp. 05-340-1]|nr:hypothetical protein CH272_11525 [Rhodococcus sp. 05-340-1]